MATATHSRLNSIEALSKGSEPINNSQFPQQDQQFPPQQSTLQDRYKIYKTRRENGQRTSSILNLAGTSPANNWFPTTFFRSYFRVPRVSTELADDTAEPQDAEKYHFHKICFFGQPVLFHK
jgi:hypothetical protein